MEKSSFNIADKTHLTDCLTSLSACSDCIDPYKGIKTAYRLKATHPDGPHNPDGPMFPEAPTIPDAPMAPALLTTGFGFVQFGFRVFSHIFR